jgi:4-oxalocrotonate tautomerase
MPAPRRQQEPGITVSAGGEAQHWNGLNTNEETAMPLVRVTLVEGVFDTEEKHAMAAELTDVMVKYEGSEAFREVVWVQIEELKRDGWHMGGRPFAGPASLMEVLGSSSAAFDKASEGETHTPTTRAEWKAIAPVLPAG